MGYKKKLKKKMKRLMASLADEYVGPAFFVEALGYSLPKDLVYKKKSEAMLPMDIDIKVIVSHAHAWASKIVGEYLVDGAVLPLYQAYIDADYSDDGSCDVRAITALLYNGSHPVQWVTIERDTYTNSWDVVNRFYHDTWDMDAKRIGALGRLEVLDLDD